LLCGRESWRDIVRRIPEAEVNEIHGQIIATLFPPFNFYLLKTDYF